MFFFYDWWCQVLWLSLLTCLGRLRKNFWVKRFKKWKKRAKKRIRRFCKRTQRILKSHHWTTVAILLVGIVIRSGSGQLDIDIFLDEVAVDIIVSTLLSK